MKLEVLGCAGGEGVGFRATSFLINDSILIDAGSVVSSTSLEQQSSIDYALITHPHLDHIKDLGFMVDNTFETRSQALKVYSTQSVIDALKKYYFNWVIWPDFTQLPTAENPVLELLPIYQDIQLNNLNISYYPVNHPGGSYGYLIEDPESDSSIVVTGDTAETELIWQAARECKNLTAIFVDTAFPDDMNQLAGASGHYTPSQLYQELKGFNLLHVPIYCYHLKPAYHDRVEADILSIGDDHFRLLQQGEILEL